MNNMNKKKIIENIMKGIKKGVINHIVLCDASRFLDSIEGQGNFKGKKLNTYFTFEREVCKRAEEYEEFYSVISADVTFLSLENGIKELRQTLDRMNDTFYLVECSKI